MPVLRSIALSIESTPLRTGTGRRKKCRVDQKSVKREEIASLQLKKIALLSQPAFRDGAIRSKMSVQIVAAASAAGG
jgi:hypothetical protein